MKWLKLPPYVVLVTCLLLTALAWFYARENARLENESRFNTRITEVIDTITERMNTHITTLSQTRGAFDVKRNLTRDDFRKYVQRIDIAGDLPGTLGIGYAVRLNRSALNLHVQSVRRSGIPDYRVWPAYEREAYSSIVYLEPMNWRNRRALGYDMFTEPTRRVGMQRACDTGEAALTGRVTLVQETEAVPQPGFLIYVPVYSTPILPPSIEARRKALIGYLYSPLRADDLFRRIFGKVSQGDGGFDYGVFDGNAVSSDRLLFDYLGNRAFERQKELPLTRVVPLEIAGHTWTLVFMASSLWVPWPSFWTPLGILTVGCLIAVFLFQVMRVLNRRSDRLRESEERYRVTAETATDAILTIDESSRIIFANRATEHVFGYTVEELLGSPVTMLMPAHLRTAHEVGLQRFVQRGKASFPWDGVELPGLKKDGKQICLEISIGKFNRRGKYLFSGIVRDITDRKAAEQKLKESEANLRRHSEELARSNADLAKFAYVASHDLKEPLRVVTNYVQLLERFYSDKLDDEGRRFVSVATDGAKRMYRLIDDLLAFSRIGSGPSNLEKVDCNDVFGEALLNLDSRIRECEAKISAGKLPVVVADRTQLVQLFQNLVSNAIKYRGPAAPVVEVSALAKHGEYEFAVADNGIGIEDGYFEKIFEIFQRLHNKDEYSGTGIGLAVCKKVVERHGGRIWVDSTPGKGATFFFTLPVDCR